MGKPTVACTLGAADLAAQARAWAELRGRAELGQTRTRRGKRIRFRDEDGVAAELERLVAVERRCCSWADWTVERDPGEIVLDVTSTGLAHAAASASFASTPSRNSPIAAGG